MAVDVRTIITIIQFKPLERNKCAKESCNHLVFAIVPCCVPQVVAILPIFIIDNVAFYAEGTIIGISKGAGGIYR